MSAENTESTDASPEQIPINLDQTIAEINNPLEGHLPVAAIRAAQANRELMIPKLIELLASETKRVKQGDQTESSGATIALFLLAEFNAKEALPAIVEAISLPDDDTYTLFGDTVTEKLQVLLAALVDPPFATLDYIIENSGISSYVRSAAMHAYACLMKLERISREEVISRLRKHLATAMNAEEKDSDQITFLISTLVDLAATEALPDIKLAFSRDLVEEFLIGDASDCIDRIKNNNSNGIDGLKHLRSFTPPDTVEEMQSWYCYSDAYRAALKRSENKGKEVINKFVDDLNDEIEPSIGISSDWNFRAVAPEPIPRPHREENAKVGRNDACPCGSGKKFKKCCGSRVTG